jgi:hypothetical protein
MADDFHGAATPLTDADLEAAATELGWERAVIDAVCDVESSGSGFLPDGRPKILFEAHAFHTATGGRWDRTNPNISSPVWDRSLYGAGGGHQYDRLAEAIALDRNAALQSASWGRFQVMGSNYSAAGFANVEAFVQAMCDGEAAHLEAFIGFCRANGLADALRDHDWTTFTHLQRSGPDRPLRGDAQQRLNRHSAHAAAAPGDQVLHLLDRGPAVTKLQQLLKEAGCDVQPDGIFGPQTEAVVRQFQSSHGLAADGIVGSQTWAALRG